MNYPHLTRILSAEFPKLKIDENTRDLDKVGMVLINGKPISIEEFLASKNLKVNGDLYLSLNKEITSLPEGLRVGGDLRLSGTKITSLPKNLKVGGDLYLNETNITPLPEGLEVGGSLWLNHTKITSLPEGLKVGGDLWLINTKITSLPKGLKVKGNIYLDDTSEIQCSEELRKKLKRFF